MRILVLESTTGLGDGVDSRLFPEGFGMLRTIVNEFEESGLEVTTTLHQEIREFEKWLENDSVFSHDELEEVFNLDFDGAVIIAPEGELARITGRIEDKGISILGASSSCVRVTGDKWKTYKALKNKIPHPETWENLPEDKDQVIVKPRRGVSAEGVKLVSTKNYHPFSKKVIFQEYIQGTHASCCLLVGKDKGTVLSVNEQKINQRDGSFEYKGGRIPLPDGNKETYAEIATKAAEELGLTGYCGVDFVVSEKTYFMELNPRLTTSFVGLAPILEGNLGELLVNVLIDNKSVSPPELDGCSVIGIPKTCEDVRINSEKIDELREIPEIISPPYSRAGILEKGSSVFLSVGRGGSFEKARKRLNEKIVEGLNLLGVDDDVVTWS